MTCRCVSECCSRWRCCYSRRLRWRRPPSLEEEGRPCPEPADLQNSKRGVGGGGRKTCAGEQDPDPPAAANASFVCLFHRMSLAVIITWPSRPGAAWTCISQRVRCCPMCAHFGGGMASSQHARLQDRGWVSLPLHANPCLSIPHSSCEAYPKP